MRPVIDTMNPTSLPATVTALPDVDAIARAARVARTVCGDGEMVWRIWNEKADGRPPVVLLHGGSGSWDHWVRNIVPLIEAGHTVYVPDMPGCGDSGPLPSGNDADAFPPFIEEGLQQLIGEQPCKLVGFSFGAMVATFLAAQQPARVERLVIVGAPGLSDQQLRRLHLKAWAHLPAGPERDAIIRNNMLILMVARPETMDDFALNMQIANLMRDRVHQRRLSQTDIVLRTLPSVTCPLHGIWGHEDALYLGRQDTIEPALRHAPGFMSMTSIAGAGHWVQYEEADAFNAALLPMLA
jgi:2-hydroxy-6-oxonona-2,4-dienedioate hydrolase